MVVDHFQRLKRSLLRLQICRSLSFLTTQTASTPSPTAHQDTQSFSHVELGGRVPGYHAIIYSIANVPESIDDINLKNECNTLDSKNLILVSDEGSFILYLEGFEST